MLPRRARADRPGVVPPRSWTDDPGGAPAAGVPVDVKFATKPALARQMIARALDANTGPVGSRGRGLRRRPRPAPRTGKPPHRIRARGCPQPPGPRPLRAPARRRPRARLPRRAWQRVSAGQGSKGPRLLRLGLDHHRCRRGTAGQRWLLIRRNNTTGELAYFRCYAPARCPWPCWSASRAARWTVEETFQAGKGLAGLGPAPGPPLGLLAPLDHPGHARLRVPGRARRHRARPPTPPDGMIPLTSNEIHHLLNACRPASPRPPASPALVSLAATPPAPRQNQPLPKTRTNMKITIYDCRTRSQSRRARGDRRRERDPAGSLVLATGPVAARLDTAHAGQILHRAPVRGSLDRVRTGTAVVA